MTYYAIRQKSTGFFIPVKSSFGRLTLHSLLPRDPSKLVPRLYILESRAKSALTYWLSGPIGSKFELNSMEVVKITMQFSWIN